MQIDLATPSALVDPHSYFRAVRAAGGPVVFAERHRAWLVLSHAGVPAGFRSPLLSAERIPAYEKMAASRPAGFARVVDLLRGWMVSGTTRCTTGCGTGAAGVHAPEDRGGDAGDRVDGGRAARRGSRRRPVRCRCTGRSRVRCRRW